MSLMKWSTFTARQRNDQPQHMPRRVGRADGMPSARHDEALEAQKEQVASRMEKTIGEGVGFERTRRITGYLSPMNRWNNAKRAEERDRVKHG